MRRRISTGSAISSNGKEFRYDRAQIARVILYVKDVIRGAAFYERFFDLHPLPGGSDKWTELAASSGGCTIALHKASVTQKSGAAIKLVFGVANVQAFKNAKERAGLKFGIVIE